jgi:hypothetical protein
LKFLEQGILKQTLQFCKQAFLGSEKNVQIPDLNLLQNTNHLFHILEEYSEAKIFFNIFLNKTRKRFNEEIIKSNIKSGSYPNYDKSYIFKVSIYYPLLIFIADVNFATGDFKKSYQFLS